MKILYICPDYGIPVLGHKGASVHIRELTAAFDRAGHSVVVTSPLATRSPWEQPEVIAGQFLHLPISDNTAPVFQILQAYTNKLGLSSSLAGEIRRIVYSMEVEPRLIRRFKKNPPDFIYLRASLYATTGVELAEALNRPLVIEVNTPLAAEQSIYRGTGLGLLALEAEGWLLSRADVVVTVSSALSEHVVKMGAKPERVHVLPNAVDAERFHPALPGTDRKRVLELEDEPVLGFVGGLRPWHGVQYLPQLLVNLVPDYPNLKLVIVGDGQMRPELEADLQRLGVAQHVIFAGVRSHEEVPDLIRRFDIALAPYPKTDHEFYFSPLKLFEYMGCGIPVIAARIGQIADIVSDEETGLLYAPGDINALTRLCKELLSDSKRRKTMGRKAAELIHAKYTWDHNAERVVELVKSL